MGCPRLREGLGLLLTSLCSDRLAGPLSVCLCGEGGSGVTWEAEAATDSEAGRNASPLLLEIPPSE